MIPLAIPNLSGREAEYLAECVSSGFVSSVGPFVTRFEQMITAASGTAQSVAVSSGTSGLHLALVSAGVLPGDLVILPSFTFIASANAVAHCGAIPWLMDVTEESWTLDPALVAEELRRHAHMENGVLRHRDSGRRIAALLPVYTLGHPADMAPLRAITDEFSLPLIADAAAALGATYRGEPGAKLADLAVYSFNGNKTFTCGGGGAVTGQRTDWLDLARHLSTTARVGADYDHDRIGYNYRMNNLTAAVGCAQLEQAETFIAAKRHIQSRYDEALADLPGVESFPRAAWAESACWFSGIALDSALAPTAISFLQSEGIGARSFWKPVHLQKPYADSPRSALIVTERIWNRVLTLPCSTSLSDADLDLTISAVHKFFAHAAR